MKRLLRPLLYAFRKHWYAGTKHECPICRSSFDILKPMGSRASARCPVCDSLERHRLIWLFCHRKTDLFDGRNKQFLHVAPEPFLKPAIRRLPGLAYVGADLEGRHANVKLDVTDINFDDNHFDVIFCSHVLEHVPDDRTAMRELLRVLKPGGWAILQVPILGEHTQEDPSIVDPQERARRYGQDDHVRQYGKDYVERLRAAGFVVDVSEYVKEFSDHERFCYGLPAEEDIYFCRKTG